VERLGSTSTVLGLFDDWKCVVAETRLGPGDTVVMYTDGVTEATDRSGDEFGEFRLLEILKARRQLPVPDILHSVTAEILNFCGGEQADDITLVIARCRVENRV